MRNRILLATVVVLAALLNCYEVRADIRLPKIFSDNMVLQRNASIRVWGWSDPGEELNITLAETTTTCSANEQGQWQVTLPAMQAGGPYQLKVEGASASVMISQIYVGEVWLCGGQDSMNLGVAESLQIESEDELKKRLAEFTNDRIRLFTIEPSLKESIPDELGEVQTWATCSSDSVESFSTIGYHFASQLLTQLDLQKEYQDTKLVIGLIDISSSQSTCESWISTESLSADESLKPLLEHWQDQEQIDNSRPSMLFNGTLAPIFRFQISGAIWYQGESNIGRGQQFQRLLPMMIDDWRTGFGQKALPFYFAQPKPKRYEEQDPQALPEIWDAQLKTLFSKEAAGLAITVDLNKGDLSASDFSQEVGRRFSLLALANNYGMEGLVSNGPIYASKSIEEDSILIKFSNVGEGLVVDGEITEFTICGEDGNFVAATATIEDEKTIRVSSPEVEKPANVRFGWTDSAQPNLKNSAGLPASPFRTDELELQSKDRHF